MIATAPLDAGTHARPAGLPLVVSVPADPVGFR